MKKINLRELYPDVYTTDFFVDVTEEVMETIRAAERVLYYQQISRCHCFPCLLYFSVFSYHFLPLLWHCANQ